MAEGTTLRNLTDEQRGALTNQGFFWLAASENHTYEEAIKIFGTKEPPAPHVSPDDRRTWNDLTPQQRGALTKRQQEWLFDRAKIGAALGDMPADFGPVNVPAPPPAPDLRSFEYFRKNHFPMGGNGVTYSTPGRPKGLADLTPEERRTLCIGQFLWGAMGGHL